MNERTLGLPLWLYNLTWNEIMKFESTVIKMCGRALKNREYNTCRGTYCLAVFQAIWRIAHTHVMHTTNLKLYLKGQAWDMARVDKTRILKQSHSAFVYGLIKSFIYFLSIKVVKAFWMQLFNGRDSFYSVQWTVVLPMHAIKKHLNIK